MAFIQTTSRPHRPLWPAMKRGMARKCPNCGEGHLYYKYLKVNETCPACGEELHHHRADDAPPYLVIVIVGHVMIGIVIYMEMIFRIAAIQYLAVVLPLAVLLSLWLLPIVKGAIVGLQWANYMHGFDPDGADDDPEEWK